MTERQQTHYVGDDCDGGHMPKPLVNYDENAIVGYKCAECEFANTSPALTQQHITAHEIDPWRTEGEHPKMTTIEERAARLRDGRRHWHCSVEGCDIRIWPFKHGDKYRLTKWKNGHTKHPKGQECTDDHNPTETALDALALAYDVIPTGFASDLLMARASIMKAYGLIAKKVSE